MAPSGEITYMLAEISAARADDDRNDRAAEGSGAMTRILLVANKSLSLHRLRNESRRSGLSFLYEWASEAADFPRLLARHPAIVVSTLNGLPGLAAPQIAAETRRAGAAFFLVGGDTAEERQALAELSGLIAGTCRQARLPWLPMLLERALLEGRQAEEAHASNTREQSLLRAAARLESAAEQMRDVQKLAIVGRMTGAIAHEINNPLESITNLTYLLSTDDQLPEHLRGYVATAEQELRRVTQISTQTLAFCRETQKPVRVEISALMEEVMVLYARRLDEKQIEVIRRFESEEPLRLFPGEMRQVYANLLANAIEATPVGGRIVVRLHRSRRRTARGLVDGLRLLVADSGSGIPLEARRKLGEPFFTTKGQRGTGLGLWVSQAIVRHYDGEIQLRSSTAGSRRGTTFSVFLPLNLRPHVVEAAVPAQKQHSGGTFPIPLDGLRLRANSS